MPLASALYPDPGEASPDEGLEVLLDEESEKALDDELEDGPEKALDKGAMLAKKPGSPISGNKIREISPGADRNRAVDRDLLSFFL